MLHLRKRTERVSGEMEHSSRPGSTIMTSLWVFSPRSLHHHIPRSCHIHLPQASLWLHYFSLSAACANVQLFLSQINTLNHRHQNPSFSGFLQLMAIFFPPRACCALGLSWDLPACSWHSHITTCKHFCFPRRLCVFLPLKHCQK